MSLEYPPVVMATIQSAALGGIANILAQVITAYRAGTGFLSSSSYSSTLSALHPTSSGKPRSHSILQTSILYPIRQDFLESAFPAHPAEFPKAKEVKGAKKTQPKLSVRNTLIKFTLDQTVGAAVNTLLFSTYVHALRTAIHPVPVITSLPKAITYWTAPGTLNFDRVNWATVWEAAKADFAPLVYAGWKLWPAVSIVNFAAVKTVEGRNLVGALAGVVWGIYMSLVAAQ
ncbi:Glomerulosclerosis Mpv17-like protein [Fusarium acuminatum]|uniref:Glomerulosclerosis Mpv17-like protein n=1 Tax=Fusarium acuminatum TaxID=5515 RepID=A0ABZ2X7P4_9HYPO